MGAFRFLTRLSQRSIGINFCQTQQRLRAHCLTGLPARHSPENSTVSYGKVNSHTQLLPDRRLQFDPRICSFYTKSCSNQAGKSDTKSAAIAEADIFGEASKLGLFAKFKLMYKKYWYVLLPVHIVTSIGWFGGFYYMSKSGVDVAALLQYLHLSESIIDKVQHSDMGHVAIAYLCYKIATPVRYAVTLGGTTLTIKHLVQLGYIKPMPSKDEILRMYEKQKAIRAAEKADKEAEKQRKDE